MKDIKKNNKNNDEIKIIENDDEFYPLNPEDIPRHSYSFTSILYNNRMNYQHDSVQRKYIGQFVLSKKLGQGTFGIVVLATHQITGENVAVKILEKERILQEADKTRIEREIKILKNMRHNNIVHLYDIKETPSSLYIIMEYVNGKELFDYIIDKNHLSELESCNYFQQIISGIEYLGKIGVVHRDLKPENLLLDEQKNIKIVDFGLSNIYKNNELLSTACGSPCYAAPEMINGDSYVGLRVDIWSSGIVLFAMLCGYLPFEDSDNEILYKKITKGKFKTPKYLSDCCKDFLHKILNVNPEKRYTIEQIKNHPWFNIINPKLNMSEGLLLHVFIVPIDENILDEMVKKLKFNEEEVRANLIANNHNHTTTTYYLLLRKKLREGKKSICDMKSKEFLNYLKNPVNLLSTYGYNLKLIIQIRNRKNKDIFEINNFDNNINKNSLTLRTQSNTNMTHKTLKSTNNKYEDQFILNNNKEIKIKTIYNKKKNELLKRINNKINGTFINSIQNKDNENIKKNAINNQKVETNNIQNKNQNKNDSTKESLNSKNNSNTINLINKEEQKSSKLSNKIKEYQISFIKKKKEINNNIEQNNSILNESLNNEKTNKNKDKNNKGKDYSFEIKNKKEINSKGKTKKKAIKNKPKRTITNTFESKNYLEKKYNFKTITERDNKESNKDKKYIKKLLEKHFTVKDKKEIKTLKGAKENTDININKLKYKNINNNQIENGIKEKDKNGYVKITDLMGRIKMKDKNNKENSKEISYENFSKDKIYYLLTEKDKNNKRNKIKEHKKLNMYIKEYNNKSKEEEKEKINFTTNNSSKLVKNLLKINSFKLKEKNEIKIKKAIKTEKLFNHERKTMEEREINKRAYNKKGFIDTSVSFDKSHDGGRFRDSTKPRRFFNIQSEKKKVNLNVKNKNDIKNLLTNDNKNNIEEDSKSNSLENENSNKKNYEELKRKEKDNKYLKLKSKNKKFLSTKKKEENNININLNNNLNINIEKGNYKIRTIKNSKQNDKNIPKRNRLEKNLNYSIKNYTNTNRKNNDEYNTIINDDISSSNKTEKRKKNSKIKQKIKALNTQGNFIKKLTIRKKHFHYSLNDSKKDIIKKRSINSSLNDKIKSFYNKEKYKSIEDIFYKTCINHDHKQIFSINSNIKKNIEEIDKENTDNKDKDENFKPLDLDFIFIKKLNDIKEIITKEMKLKKYKYKIKKNGYLLYKNKNQIELDFHKINNNNLYNIKVMKKQGNYLSCKNIIKNLVSKLK